MGSAPGRLYLFIYLSTSCHHKVPHTELQEQQTGVISHSGADCPRSRSWGLALSGAERVHSVSLSGSSWLFENSHEGFLASDSLGAHQSPDPYFTVVKGPAHFCETSF